MAGSSTEIEIYEALVALARRGAEDSFVLIEEPRTEKFVQFGKGRSLGMDVPCVALTNDEADRAYQFFQKLGEGPREYRAPDTKNAKKIHYGAAFYHDFGKDTRAAATAAVSFFRDVYNFPHDVSLTIKEH